MKTINLAEGITTTTEVRDSLKGNIYVTRYSCGCETVKSPYENTEHLCPSHTELPKALPVFTEKINLDSHGFATTHPRMGEATLVRMTGSNLEKIWRRCAVALQESNTDQLLACAEILNVKITD